MTTCSSDTDMPGYSSDREENHTRHGGTPSPGLLPSRVLPVHIGWHRCGIILPQARTVQCQEGPENRVPIDFQAGADLDCPRMSPFTWALCSWHGEETQLETVEFLWRLLLTKQARDPTAEFMAVLAEQDSLWGSSLLGARWGAGLFTQHLRPNSWGDCNHLILPCWLEEEFGYTTRGRGFLSSFLAVCLFLSPLLCFKSFLSPHPLSLYDPSPLPFSTFPSFLYFQNKVLWEDALRQKEILYF